MKILSTNFFINTQNVHQVAPRVRNENQYDTFTRTTNTITPSFKQSPVQQVAELFKQALKGTNVSPNELMMLGLATLGLTTISKDALDKLITNFAKQNENVEEPIEQEIGQINNTSQEEVPPQETSDIPKTEVAPEENIVGLISPNFPKRRGHLTEGQLHLKEVVGTIKIPPELEEKLIAVCKELLITKKSHKFNNDILSNSELAELMANRLKDKYENCEDLKSTIDVFYDVCELESENENVTSNYDEEGMILDLKQESESETASKEESQTEESKSINKEEKHEEVFRIGVQKLEGPKVLYKVDPSKLNTKTRATGNTNKKARVVVSVSANSTAEAQSQSPAKPSVKSADNELMVKFKDLCKDIKVTLTNKDGEFLYSLPIAKASELNYYDILTSILLRYEKEFSSIEKDKDIKWRNSPRTGAGVGRRDIINELNAAKKGENEPYKKINIKNAEEIAEVIKSDVRFQQMFSLHAAMRLIERFVDLNNEDESIEEQCHQILDCFESIIKKSIISENGLFVKSYCDKKRKYYAPRIIINPAIFDKNERKWFGTIPLIFGLCEEQDPSFYNKDRKEPLVATIFSDI